MIMSTLLSRYPEVNRILRSQFKSREFKGSFNYSTVREILEVRFHFEAIAAPTSHADLAIFILEKEVRAEIADKVDELLQNHEYVRLLNEFSNPMKTSLIPKRPEWFQW